MFEIVLFLLIFIMICDVLMYCIILLCFVIIVILELSVIGFFIFVLINGLFVCNVGIVWCCMFVFINVWFVLLCFRNGISVVVIDIICWVEMFI